MKGIKPADLRAKKVEELKEMVDAEKAALYKARRDLMFRQITDTASLKVRRKNVAKILTVISEKEKVS